MVEGVDAGGGAKHGGGALVGMAGDPTAEVLVDRRFPTAQPQHRRNRAQRWRAPDGALPAEADAGEGRACKGRQEIALDQPFPERAVLIYDVRTKVGLIRTAGAAGAPAEILVRLEQSHARAALSRRDRSDHAGDPTPNNRDLAHRALAFVD